MQGSKKIALLRQVEIDTSGEEIRGVAKLVHESGVFGVRLSIVNLRQQKNGEYFVYLDEIKYPLIDLYGGFFACDRDFDGGVVIVLKEQNRIIPLAYGKFSQSAKTFKEIINSETTNHKKEEVCAQKTDIFSAQEYDDEAIATDDYYEFDKQRGKLSEEFFSTNNQTVDGNSQDKRQEKEADDNSSFGDYESECCSKNEFGATYYERIKDQLKKIFNENPKEIALENMVKNSRWVRMGKNENSYVVGIILDRNVPRYICYGLNGTYLSKPNEIKTYSSFIPKSPFNLKGEGYWVMFQNAISGESDKL